jgi:tetratricopeptide (TPR) repeat protein
MDENEVVVETNVEQGFEEQAREQGWKPKEEYQGDPSKWRSAKEFVDRGELFTKIDSLGRELKDTKKALAMLQEHHTKVKETEYKKALEELKNLQKKHLEEGNSDGYLETTELLTDLKAEQKAREVYEKTVPQQPQIDPRFATWLDNNKWYQRDEEMRQLADTIGTGYAKMHPNIDPEEVLQYVTNKVKAIYKDKLENPNRTKPNLVGTSDSASGSKTTGFQLTEDEKRVMNTFIRQGIMTKEDYIKEIKATKGVV